MDLSSTSQMSTSTQVAFHIPSDALAVTSEAEADAEREALEGLFQMSLTTEAQLSDAMDDTITRMQSANNELMSRFQDVSEVNDELNRRIIEATSRVTNLSNAAQAQQEAHEAQIQQMQRQIAALEQEKAEMLRQRNEEVAAAAGRQIEAVQAATEANQAQIEALNLAHATALATRDNTHANALETMANTHLRAMETLNGQLTVSRDAHRTATEMVAYRDEELKQVREQLTKTQKELQGVFDSFESYEAMRIKVYCAGRNPAFRAIHLARRMR